MEREWREALEATCGLNVTPKSLEKAAAQLGPDRARWGFEQWALRRRGAAKFAAASEMLFDRPGLEMASHERVAAYHASRFPDGVLAADLTTGIGADLLALARRGPAVGFELDETRLRFAQHNLEVSGLRAELRREDSLLAEWSVDFAFADPARRTGDLRTLNPADFSPNPLSLAGRLTRLKLGGIKLSPMLKDEFLLRFEGALEFISFEGECREALVWLGTEAGAGRSAVMAQSRERLEEGPQPESSCVADAFLYEADPAAVRAHALGPLCLRWDLRPLGDSNGYLTGARLVESTWLTPFEVLADHPADDRRTAKVLRSLGGGTPVVKSRVPRYDVEGLRKRLSREGRELTVAVYPNGKKLRHAVLQRLG